MHSFDFEEFIWANGVKLGSVDDIKEYFEKHEPVPPAMYERMMALFKEYIAGGSVCGYTIFISRYAGHIYVNKSQLRLFPL